MASFLSSLFSPVKLHAWWLRRSFIRAGLQAHRAELDNGVVHCWRGGQGAPLILLHGFGASALWQWPNQVGRLSAHHDLLLPDLVYFGESSSDKGAYSVDFQAETMMQLLDAQGLERVHLMGLSYGGLVAPYESQWLEIELQKVRPRKGRSTLEVTLHSRPADLYGDITVVDLEVIVHFGPYPTRRTV